MFQVNLEVGRLSQLALRRDPFDYLLNIRDMPGNHYIRLNVRCIEYVDRMKLNLERARAMIEHPTFS